MTDLQEEQQMTGAGQEFYKTLGTLGETVPQPVPVTLSPELIGLLSEQLYRSPSKAIEELVVNAYDADADEARIFVAAPGTDATCVAVYDDGLGMSYQGIADLWKVGRPKPRAERLQRHTNRKQIGKFGIGKLSTYAIANRVTYITKTGSQHYGVTIDYREFASKPDTTTTAVDLEIRQIDDIGDLLAIGMFSSVVEQIGLNPSTLGEKPSWTLVILEDLKPKAREMHFGRLRWVLRTAMPLGTSFKLFLNGDEVESSKAGYEVLVEFDLSQLPEKRLKALTKKTGEVWRSQDGALTCESFPSGITGSARVTRQTLLGKSADLGRSEGFFVYVRKRLVNEEDARFGLHELSHRTLNRFRSEVFIDDLDDVITANRESMEDVEIYRDAQALLNEVFNEARQRYEEHDKKESKKKLGTREEQRDWVPKRLVEHPTADALTSYSSDPEGADADESWMYLDVDRDTDAADLARQLYAPTPRSKPYKYVYASLGRSERVVAFDPANHTFTLNQDHELATAYAGDPMAERLLHDVATSEAMLEVYLREVGVRPHVVGEVLERRDLLLRGLADAQMFSLDSLSQYINDSAASSRDLEIAVVAGARALGFVAKHLGGTGEPDGIARFADYPEGEQTIILEAKSSKALPSAKDIDFAAIARHMEDNQASGCLLVAPGYQGGSRAGSATSAESAGISCWTVEQYAAVVAAAESRHISARRVLEVVHQEFTPQQVTSAVGRMLDEPSWESPELHRAVVRALREMKDRLPGTRRNVDMIASSVSGMTSFGKVHRADVRDAIADLASASHGGLRLRSNEEVVLNVDYDELERRLEDATKKPGTPRRRGAFGATVDAQEPPPRA